MTMWSENRLTGNCENVVKAQKLISKEMTKKNLNERFIRLWSIQISYYIFMHRRGSKLNSMKLLLFANFYHLLDVVMNSNLYNSMERI